MEALDCQTPAFPSLGKNPAGFSKPWKESAPEFPSLGKGNILLFQASEQPPVPAAKAWNATRASAATYGVAGGVVVAVVLFADVPLVRVGFSFLWIGRPEESTMRAVTKIIRFCLRL